MHLNFKCKVCVYLLKKDWSWGTCVVQSGSRWKCRVLWGRGEPSYRGWTAEPARTWVSRRWSRTLFSERRRAPAGGQTWSSVDLVAVAFFCLLFESHFLLSSGLSSCRGSLACLCVFFVCLFFPGVRSRWRRWTQEKKVFGVFGFFFFCASNDSHLLIVGGSWVGAASLFLFLQENK